MTSMDSAAKAIARAIVVAATSLDEGTAHQLITDLLDPLNPGIVERVADEIAHSGQRVQANQRILDGLSIDSPGIDAYLGSRDAHQAAIEQYAATAARDWCRAVRLLVLTEQRPADVQAELDELIANPEPDYRHTDAYNMR